MTDVKSTITSQHKGTNERIANYLFKNCPNFNLLIKRMKVKKKEMKAGL